MILYKAHNILIPFFQRRNPRLTGVSMPLAQWRQPCSVSCIINPAGRGQGLIPRTQRAPPKLSQDPVLPLILNRNSWHSLPSSLRMSQAPEFPEIASVIILKLSEGLCGGTMYLLCGALSSLFHLNKYLLIP